MRWRTVFAAYMILSFQTILAQDVAELVRNSDIQGGIVVHLNCGDGRDTAAMRLNDSYIVHGLDVDAENVAAAKNNIQSTGLYGSVSVAQYNGRTLPYSDNIVNLFVTDLLSDVPKEEAMRVLAPLGVLIVGGEKTVKPWPDNIDEWPQYLNNADNNAVAMDTVAGPPRHIQWVDSPTWCRSHMGIPTVASVVTGNGRLFTIEDASPPDNPFLPSEFRIVARDAFNGKQLWTRVIDQWESVTMYIKCQPLQQQRRMVVVGDTLYCTLTLEGPVSALDAATGEILTTYENTSPTQELAYNQGIMYLNVGERFNTSAYNIVKLKSRLFVEGADPSEPFYGGGFREGYAPEISDRDNPISDIMAVDPATGETLWAVRDIDTYTAGTLSIKGGYAVYQAADGLFCINSKTGEEIWRVEKTIVNALGHDSLTPGTLPNTVVIADDKVFAVEGSEKNQIASNPDNTVFAYSLQTGDLLWQAPAQGNYESSSDICFVNGTLWVGGRNPTQHDADTGEVLSVIVQQMTGPMGHDRCYRNYITERYFINSKTGGADFLELETGQEFPHHWTRGGCGLGVLPANGLVYATPYSCQCSQGSMFQGMNAYSSVTPRLEASDQPIEVQRSERLEKGPAYGTVPIPYYLGTEGDWPAYRYNGARSGTTPYHAPETMHEQWSVQLPSRPSAITNARGQVFISDIDSHTLYALDETDGQVNWTFTADGRIDSPPTYYQGILLFGSRDGWVYCLRAADGALAWRFKDLPDKLIGAFGQLESAWPVSGSVLVLDDTLYFSAGRSSFLDGGIFIYAMNPHTGELLRSRANYGPFTPETGFPVGNDAGFKNDVLVTDGTLLYLRQKAFSLDLSDADEPGNHIIASAGFLDGEPQHRTNWRVGDALSKQGGGDILVRDNETTYTVQGFPLYANHSYFDPRRSGYLLTAGSETSGGPRGRNITTLEQWRLDIPITGKAMAKGGDILLVAGEPMRFEDPRFTDYVEAYDGDLGGRLLAVSADDGTLLSEYELNASPVWDGIAIADERAFIALEDGKIVCFGE
jgi:outer membrane protein assembly factor BamB